MSLLHPEDFLHNQVTHNIYWSQLLRTVDEFDQLMELCTQKINRKKINSNIIQLVRQFTEYKDSLRFEGQVRKKTLHFIQTTQFSHFFKGYYHSILDIIEKVILQPKILVQLITQYQDNKKYKFQDFFQNIVFNVYQYYLPTHSNAPLIHFIQNLLKKWPYNPQLVRPTHYTLIDQALTGIMRAPVVVCYIQRIVTRFLKDAELCHLSTFTVDQEAIQSQIQTRKQINATFSHSQAQKTSFKDKFLGIFKSKKQQQPRNSYISDNQSFLSQSSQNDERKNIKETMKGRQNSLFDLIRKTLQSILKQQLPMFLCKIFASFDQRLNTLLKKQSQCRLKHYCYFLMTNLILSQLHNKFTISYQQSGMNPAALQNISYIIKCLNALLQGIMPGLQKNTVVPHYFSEYKPLVQQFYENIVRRGKIVNKQQDKMLELLLNHYQMSIIVSLNDLSLVLALLQSAKPSTNIVQPQKYVQFLKNKQAAQLFENIRKNGIISMKGNKILSENVFIVYQSRHPSIKQVIDYYLTIDQPLADIPLIRQILINQSNLQINQTLQIQQDLKLITKLPLKQIRNYLGKIAHKFRQLRVKDGRAIQHKFQDSFRSTLARSLLRKQWLLYYRAQLSQQLGTQSSLINQFTKQLNSAVFYQRMANAFCDSMKIKVYLSIQSQIFKVHQNANQLKKIQISTLMVAKDDKKSNSSNENYILRNSFKLFQNYKQLVRCIAKNQITKSALARGRKIDQFNQTFQSICNIVTGYIKIFVSQKKIMQILSEQKLSLIVVNKIQSQIVQRFRNQKISIQKDKQLLSQSTKINKNLFWEKDLSDLGIDKQFFVSQGVDKFKKMVQEQNIQQRIIHFTQLFKVLLTVLGFTLAKNKISAQVVNPLVQYLILQCAQLKHHQCLFSIQALRWRGSAEDQYNLTLYQSSLTYIRQMMAKDYPL